MFKADGVFVFHGSRTGLMHQLKKNDVPFTIGMHGMAH